MDDGQASPTAKSEGHDLSTASPHTTIGDGGPNGRGAEKGDLDGAEGGQPKAKRRRVAVACKSCRYRKSRVSCVVFLSVRRLDCFMLVCFITIPPGILDIWERFLDIHVLTSAIPLSLAAAVPAF